VRRVQKNILRYTKKLCYDERIKNHDPHKRKSSTRAFGELRPSAKANPVDFQNFTGTSMSTNTSVTGIYDQFFQKYEPPNCGKIPYLAMLQNPSNNSSVRPDPEVDAFQNLFISSSSTVKLVTDRQTNPGKM